VLAERGFAIEEDGLVECWLAPDDRPPISSSPDGYRLSDRSEAAARPHHMVNERRGHVDPEPRLKQTSLYRSDLDLCVYDANDDVAGYGLFWHNPATGVGVVEPMRTEDNHQQRGVARHVLTAGIDRLVRAGATRLKVAFEPGNPAAKHLYLSCGFEPHRENDLFAGPTST
jgi:GNAT superfamily N-acetyltransferase